MASERLLLKAAVVAIPLSSHVYEIDIPLDFCFGNTAHGGYQATMIAHTAQKHFSTTLKHRGQPHSFNMHIMFLRPVTAGKAELEVKDLKLGPGVSTIQVIITQGGKERVAAYVSNMDMHANHGVSYETDYKLIPAVTPADVLKLASGSASQWIQWTFPWNAGSFLKPYTHFRFYIPIKGPPHPSLTDVWITPENKDDVFTTETLGLVADIWPRMVENYCPESEWSTTSLVNRALRGAQISEIDTDFGYGRHPQAYWYPTLSMTLEIKRLLPPGGVKWLFMRAQAKKIENGRMDTEVTILNQCSELVALSHHVCLVIDNTDGPLKEMAGRKEKL